MFAKPMFRCSYGVHIHSFVAQFQQPVPELEPTVKNIVGQFIIQNASADGSARSPPQIILTKCYESSRVWSSIRYICQGHIHVRTCCPRSIERSWFSDLWPR